jgi:hypothetical protein
MVRVNLGAAPDQLLTVVLRGKAKDKRMQELSISHYADCLHRIDGEINPLQISIV